MDRGNVNGVLAQSLERRPTSAAEDGGRVRNPYTQPTAKAE